jgi:cytochrome o ubiquinol oxidase subunit 2
MHFDVRAVPADQFAAWVAATRKSGPVLDNASYTLLEKQSLHVTPFTYSNVSADLFHDITTQKLPPGPGPQTVDAAISPHGTH